MITGYGAEAVRNYYAIYGGDVKGKKQSYKVLNVGSAAAFLLSRNGCTCNGIDRDGGLINEMDSHLKK
jgi:hypothetical protein